MIRVLVVDDEKHGIDAVVKMVKRIPDLKLVGKETDPIAALNKIVSGALQVDIVFLDIGMEEMSGEEFCKRQGNRAVVIFVTGHTDYALTAFRLGAVDYLTKPIQVGDFIDAVNKAKEKLIAREKMSVFGHQQRCTFIKLSPKNILGVELNELIYVKSDDKYIYLQIGKAKPLMIKKAISYMEAILPPDMFLRIHQSCLVNMTYVKDIVANRLILKDGQVLEIGSTYINDVYSRF
ncbi:LytTR family DNA-binding domain-containing protein [Pedobacter nutrimenti]|uniref:LytR/AlgR family response regulator transcription factor n=1 Tax=Pedobacter nutrimenti TaxID=1241337 RepID=UPI00292D7E27|nr:LytTR family DNA-binding domain-containing protein [Pedobacter nutrimenti]